MGWGGVGWRPLLHRSPRIPFGYMMASRGNGIPLLVSATSILIVTVVFSFPGSALPLPLRFSPERCTATDPGEVGICQGTVIPNGYKCQEFQVKTEDGYVLSMQRIPEGRGGDGAGTTATRRRRRRPVLLQHGILMDGMTWLLNSPDQSLAFIMADAGYDVWIANTRGTRWSRGHESLDPCSPAYWNWSWDELVVYDLPATVNFVYAQTGQKLHYVGHSLGTLIALTSFSERRLLDKLRSSALLSPVAYLSHMTTPIGILLARSFVGEMIEWLGVAEFNPKVEVIRNFLNSLCHTQGINCYDLMTVITGLNCCLNSSTVDLFLKYEPQSTSTKTLIHLAQTFRDRTLAKYNYGNMISNLMHYGQIRPPQYNLENIPSNLPLFLSYGGRDSLSDASDVALLLDSLKSHDKDKITVQFIEEFAHADFVMGVSAKQKVYDAVITFFNRNQ